MRTPRRALWFGISLIPIAIFALLRLSPGADSHLQAPVFHFYIVTFTSFAALVAALFVASAVQDAEEPHVIFLTLGFTAIAAIFLLHGLATPGVIIEGFNQAVGWSARLSLLAGAGLFALGSVQWPASTARVLLRHRAKLWIGLTTLYAAYTLIAFGYPDPLAGLSNLEPGIDYGLGSLSVGLYLWAGWRAWRRAREGGRAQGLWFSVGVAMILLAEAQISMILGPLWQLSWWLYHVMMLVAFITAVGAIAREYEATRDFRPARYFAALGSLTALALAFLSGEIVARLTDDPGARVSSLALVLTVSLLLFISLYQIVRRADRLIGQRTAELKREQRRRADLTRLLVHDIKNPLSAVVANLNVMDSGVAGGLTEKQKGYLRRALDSAGDVEKLLSDMLDYERLQEGVFQAHETSVSLGRLVTDRVRAYETVTEQQGQTIKVRLPDGLPEIVGDPDLLQRMVDNLLANATKYAGPNGRIELAAAADNGRVHLDVFDDGPGVPAGERERIFERYYQGGDGDRRGAGLGLAFCKQVMELHQGRIWVDESPLGGAAFHLDFPLLEAEASGGT